MPPSPPAAPPPNDADGHRRLPFSLFGKLGAGLGLTILGAAVVTVGVFFATIVDDGLAARYAPEPCVDVAVLTDDITARRAVLTREAAETQSRIMNMRLATGRARDAVGEARVAPLVPGYAKKGVAELEAAREQLQAREAELAQLHAALTAREAALADLVTEKTERLRGRVLCSSERADGLASGRDGA